MEDLDFVKGHEDAINNESTGEFFKVHPEKVAAITEIEKESFYQKIKSHDRRFRSLIPYISNTRIYIKSITEKTKLSAAFLLFHKTIQTWSAINILAKKGFYYEVMELSRSTSENIDLANMFILADKDNTQITKWFNGETIGNRIARDAFEAAFNSSGVFPEILPVAKTLASMYDTMSKYTHGGYGAMLELINVFTKDFDYDRSAGFHRLDEQAEVLENLVNKIHYSLIFYYTNLVGEKDKADELIKLVPQSKDRMTTEEIKKHYENK